MIISFDMVELKCLNTFIYELYNWLKENFLTVVEEHIFPIILDPILCELIMI